MVRRLTTDGHLLFITRIARMFGYGFLSVVLVLYLTQAGLSETQIGLLLTLTLIGDTIISLWITTHADRIGRRRMLIAGAFLMVFAGVLFALTRNFIFLLIAATIGVISPSGYEVGPFLSIEQAALSQILHDEKRTHVFAWYNLVGSFATALGALGGGGLVQALQDTGVSPLGSYRVIVIGYAVIGAILGGLFTRLSPGVEIQAGGAPPQPASAFKTRLGCIVQGGWCSSYPLCSPSMPLRVVLSYKVSWPIGSMYDLTCSPPFWGAFFSAQIFLPVSQP